MSEEHHIVIAIVSEVLGKVFESEKDLIKVNFMILHNGHRIRQSSDQNVHSPDRILCLFSFAPLVSLFTPPIIFSDNFFKGILLPTC